MFCCEEVKNGKTYFWAFYPNTMCVKIHKPEGPIYKVLVREDESGMSQYWGWWDLDDPQKGERFVHVYPNKMLLNILIWRF